MLPPARLQAWSVGTWAPAGKKDAGGGGGRRGGPCGHVELNAGRPQKAAGQVGEDAGVEAWILGGVETVHPLDPLVVASLVAQAAAALEVEAGGHEVVLSTCGSVALNVEAVFVG